MASGLTPSERFVSDLCTRSFLQLWTHPNPKGKKGKELCDCLIVCGPHIVIISVKECTYKDTGNKTGWDRWHKNAIQKSADQIRGAERFLNSASHIERRDGRVVQLPEMSDRRYHRISVSLGGNGQVPIKWGDFGNGFIHVCDEVSVGVLFGELDTITDFIEFLTESERLITGETKLIFDGGGIEDLIALYLSWGHLGYPDASQGQPGMMILQNDLWKGYSQSQEYIEMKASLEKSYIWDQLIEIYTECLLDDGMFDMHSKEVTDDQSTLVEMAMQPRRYRANLGEAFWEILEKPDLKVAARAVVGFNKTAFVFLLRPSSDREARMQELGLRCWVIRGITSEIVTVVGIATDRPGSSSIGYSTDFVYISIPEWPDEYDEKVRDIQENLGYFQSGKFEKRKVHAK